MPMRQPSTSTTSSCRASTTHLPSLTSLSLSLSGQNAPARHSPSLPFSHLNHHQSSPPPLQPRTRSVHIACDRNRTAPAPHRASTPREKRRNLEHVGPTGARASARNERGHKWAAQRWAGAAWRHGGPAGRAAAAECDGGGCAAEPAELEPDSEFCLLVYCWRGGGRARTGRE
jgi:hypothetical protein